MWDGATGGSSMFQTALINFSSTVDFIALGGGPLGGRMPLGARGAIAPAAVSNADAGGGIDGGLMWEGAIGTSGAGPFPLPFLPLKPDALMASSFWTRRSVGVVLLGFGSGRFFFPFLPLSFLRLLLLLLLPKMKDFQPETFLRPEPPSSPKFVSTCLSFCSNPCLSASFSCPFFSFFLPSFIAPPTSNSPPISSVASYWSSTLSQSATPTCLTPFLRGWSFFCSSSFRRAASAAAFFFASSSSNSSGSRIQIHFSVLPSTTGSVFLSSPASISALQMQISAQASKTPPTRLHTCQGRLRVSALSSLFTYTSLS
mmetsp:Transcript_6012/g.10939  ORF Transcript_6012/g.10939 Transcript_6012/m.10939 type:complete len:314 (-) Transcript_6012:185-1126(-)